MHTRGPNARYKFIEKGLTNIVVTYRGNGPYNKVVIPIPYLKNMDNYCQVFISGHEALIPKANM
jgi:hypothetical protein